MANFNHRKAERVQISNRFSELERLLHFLEDFAVLHRVPTEVLFHARLALEEIVTNILQYGYRDRRDHSILIRIELRNQELVITIADDAISFNPLVSLTQVKNRPKKDKALGGHGLLLVRKLMDEMAYRRRGNQNILMMKKKWT
jgi:anti-sigma regulatory factor (Ser/Thr protein kinase)